MLTALPVFAQLDNTVEVTNEVKPVVTDVKKVEVKAKAAEAKMKHYTMEYAVKGQPLSEYAPEPLGDYRSESVWKGNKRGYLHLAGGSHGNLNGQFGYQFDFSDADALDIDLSLKGFNGKAKDNPYYGIKEWKSRDYRNRAALKFSHNYSNGAEFYAKGAFENWMFNYMDIDAPTDKQHNVLGNFDLGLTPYTAGRFTFGASAGVDFFSQKYRTNLADKLGETFFHANADVAYEVADSHSVGLGLGFVSSNYGDVEIDGITRLRFTPHYIYNGEQMMLQLGVFVNTKGEVAPDVRFTYHINRNSDVYVEARGYDDDNHLRRLSAMHPYFMLDIPEDGVKHELNAEFHQIDARLGFRFKTDFGFSGNINGGFDYSKNASDMDALYCNDNGLLCPWLDFSRNRRFYANADFVYAYNDIVKIDARNALNMESGEHIDKWISGSYIAPAFEMQWTADVRIVRGLYFGLAWDFATYSTPDLPQADRVLYKRLNTVNLGANLRYTLPINLPFTIFVKGDNLLNQKFDRYFGYRSIGANVLAGFAMSF